MKEEYRFSKGERGKFFHPNAEFKLPIYLDEENWDFVEKIAKRKNSDISTIVNKLIRSDKNLAEILG